MKQEYKPKTLEEQIARKCVHFNGIMNDHCEAGVKYADVRVEREGPYLFPCLRECDSCSQAKFLTAEEVQKEIEKIEGHTGKVLQAVANLKRHYKETKQSSGSIHCACGGSLRYAVAQNGHIRAACNNCDISFVE